YEDACRQIWDDEPPLQSLIKYNYVASSSNILIRRSFFDNHGGFNERLTYCHDYELLLRVFRQYPVDVLRERLVRYRLHEANTIAQNAFLRHLETLYCLFTTVDMDGLLAKPSLAERSACDLYRGLIGNRDVNPAIWQSEWNALLDEQVRQADTQLRQADTQLRQADTQLRQTYRQLQQADEWLTQNGIILQEKDRQLSELQASKDRQLRELQASKDRQLREIQTLVGEKNRQLDEIYSSKGWRWLTRYRKMKAFFGITPGKKSKLETEREKPDSLTYHAEIRYPLNEDRPKIIHAIANVWVGGSSRQVVDIIEYLGHKYDKEVVTYGIPTSLAYDGFPCHDFSHLSS
ncbi:MAG: hypothetical protein IH628_05280, partial [Proteobacteria bacterium]|nr:hypothetical protein [Pseudomonadota bacterium]